MRTKKLSPYIGFLILNFTFFMMDTTSGYFSIYLNEIGLTKTNIGMITAVSSLVALLFQPTLGLIADRVKSKNSMLQGTILVTALLYPLVLLNKDVKYILLVYTGYTVLRRCQPSLNTSMSLEYVEQSGQSYGPIRMMGAIGYALMMAIVAQVSKKSTQTTFFAYSAICLINVLLIFLLPPSRGHQSAGNRQPFSLVLKNKPVIKLIAFAMIMSLAQGLYFSFFAIFFTEELGGSNALYGTMLSMAALCEIPFLFFADRMIKKIGTKRMLFIIALLDGGRWLATFFITSPYPQMLIQAMNFLNILMTVSVSMKLSRLVIPQFKTTVLTLATTAQTVTSLLISSFLGGVFADMLGIRSLFLGAGVLSVITALVFHFIIFKDSLDELPVAPISVEG